MRARRRDKRAWPRRCRRRPLNARAGAAGVKERALPLPEDSPPNPFPAIVIRMADIRHPLIDVWASEFDSRPDLAMAHHAVFVPNQKHEDQVESRQQNQAKRMSIGKTIYLINNK